MGYPSDDRSSGRPLTAINMKASSCKSIQPQLRPWHYAILSLAGSQNLCQTMSIHIVRELSLIKIWHPWITSDALSKLKAECRCQPCTVKRTSWNSPALYTTHHYEERPSLSYVLNGVGLKSWHYYMTLWCTTDFQYSVCMFGNFSLISCLVIYHSYIRNIWCTLSFAMMEERKIKK